jgi:hypothetical protein
MSMDKISNPPLGEWMAAPAQPQHDRETGVRYDVLTGGVGNNPHVYFNCANFTGDGRFLIFRSDRTGWLWTENFKNYELYLDDAATPGAWRTPLPACEPDAEYLFTLDNWNEWGEGHYLAPHVTDGFGYLDAVREVFTRCDNAPDHRLPAELGLGPYDAGYASVNEHVTNLQGGGNN